LSKAKSPRAARFPNPNSRASTASAGDRCARPCARVVSLSQQELSELYEIRESLEGMACRLAAERMPPAEIAELRGVLEAHERDAAFQAGLGYYQQEGDYDFHYRIVKGSGNQMLFRMLCDELYQLARMYRIQYSTTPNRPRQAYAEHHRILDAIADHDGELAEILMRRHIRASRINIEQQIAQSNLRRTEA
jgi:DNA-binding GntR family transcriptional regulator